MVLQDFVPSCILPSVLSPGNSCNLSCIPEQTNSLTTESASLCPATPQTVKTPPQKLHSGLFLTDFFFFSVTMPAHVMLSYQWDDQALVKKIYNRLKDHGLPVWMDIEGGVTGNINDS